MQTRPRRCLIFNPDFPVLGGGERYTVALGHVIAETHQVTYAAHNAPGPSRLTQLGFPALDVQVLQDHEFPAMSRAFDLAVVVTMRVPPPSFAATSLVVAQFPLEPIGVNARVLRHYHCIVYSEYVRHWLKKRWRAEGEILMPGIEVATTATPVKEQLILSVARFVGALGSDWSKRQDVLIDAFAQLPAHLRDSWRLVLAGSYAPSSEMDAFIAALQERAAGLPVTIETNVSPQRLSELRDRARFFWHATGFERPETHPERAEHFGMSTAEAMSHGAIPLVFGDGGQPEIVDQQAGRIWHTIPELVEQTTALMALPSADLDAMARVNRESSRRFGSDRFERDARAMLERFGTRRTPYRFHHRLHHVANALRRRIRWARHRRAMR